MLQNTSARFQIAIGTLCLALIQGAVPARCALAQTPVPPSPAAAAPTADQAAIRALIADHYVTGVFVTRDEAAVRNAFHPRFHLFVLDSDTIIVAPLDMWLGRLSLDGVRGTKAMRHEVAFIDVAGNAAVARTELYEDGQHIYTDYFSLYRFSNKCMCQFA